MKDLVLTCLIICIYAFHAEAQEKRLLSLEECIEIAVENNLAVQRSRLDLATSRVNLTQAVGKRYPTINLDGNYGFNWGRSIDPTTNQFANRRVNFNGIGGSSSMPLVQGFQTSNAIKQSRLEVEASEFDVQKTINDISLSTSLIYLNVIFNKELLENVHFQLESSQQQLDRTKKLVESGMLPVSNELQLASQVATNEVGVIIAENNLGLAVLDLKQALLLPAGQGVDIVIPDIQLD